MPSKLEEEHYLSMYDQYADAIFRFCLYRVYNRDLARDITQETFMRTWREMTKGKKIENTRALLYKIARNLIIDSSRKKKDLSLETLELAGFNPGTDKEASEMQNKIEVKRLLGLLNEMNEKDRECVELRYIQGLHIGDIAEIFSCSRSSVSVRLYRALRKLKNLT